MIERERFMAHVLIDEQTQCWLWMGCRNKSGYGRVALGSISDGTRRTDYAHRVSYIMHKGEIPAGYVIDHLCRRKPCCNPQHLEAVPPVVNQMRGIGPLPKRSRLRTRRARRMA